MNEEQLKKENRYGCIEIEANTVYDICKIKDIFYISSMTTGVGRYEGKRFIETFLLYGYCEYFEITSPDFETKDYKIEEILNKKR